MAFFKAYAACLATFLLLDGLWLGLIAKSFYFGRLDHLLADKPNMAIAGAFYLVYVAGVILLISQPLLDRALPVVLGRGALLGLLTYGTYNLTNMSTLRDWPGVVSAVDMVWGISLTAALSAIGWAVLRQSAS